MSSARPSAALQPPADTRRIGRIRSETISTAAIFALTIILILASRFVSPALGSWDQVDTIITLASFLIVVAFGQGLVILVGGLDLSIASMITLGGVLATTWNGSLGSEWVVIPAVLLLCACIGALNAVGVIRLNIPPFIMTMASGIIVASAALGYTSGTPRGAAPDTFLALMKGSVGRLSAVLIFVVIFVLIAWALQSATAFGRRLYAVGANREAARIAGVTTWRPIMAAYAISAVCAGFAGMMRTARLCAWAIPTFCRASRPSSSADRRFLAAAAVSRERSAAPSSSPRWARSFPRSAWIRDGER